VHESDVENAALAWFENQGWTTINWSDIASGESGGARCRSSLTRTMSCIAS
jgi:hypothetical protein